MQSGPSSFRTCCPGMAGESGVRIAVCQIQQKRHTMITRRAVLSGAAAAAAAIATRPISVFAEASQPATPVNFDVPANACDCHTHIFDPARFPYSSVRTYTPEPASIAEMERLHGALRTPRVVIVQPS